MYRIFIVEDDSGIAGAIQKQTESWGMEASVGADGYFTAFFQWLLLVSENQGGV